MLSGLRFVSRDEADSKSRHRKKENKHSLRRHGKEKNLQRKESKKERASKKRQVYDSSSTNSSDGDEAAGIQSGDHEEVIGGQQMETLAADRKAAGLEWMVKAPPSGFGIDALNTNSGSEERLAEENLQENPKELNPFLKNGGDGYPSENFTPKRKVEEVAVVGDGGLSWRLKALKRAKEQAEREGRKLDKVVEERWGSLAEMTTSVSAKRAAHAHAHLHATRERKNSGNTKPEERDIETSAGLVKITEDDKDLDNPSYGSRNLKDRRIPAGKMKAPPTTESLYWKRRKDELRQSMRPEDQEVFTAAASALNQFQNDGSFMQNFKKIQPEKDEIKEQEHSSADLEDLNSEQCHKERRAAPISADLAAKSSSSGVNANQLAAKALQLQLQGKVQESEELLNQLQHIRQKEEEFSAQNVKDNAVRGKHEANTGYKQSLKSIMGDHKHRSTRNDRGDIELARHIVSNKQYSRSTFVDEEYESVSGACDDPPSKSAKRKGSKSEDTREAKQAVQAHRRIITQEERCQFCFSNQSRPKHLTISIANCCYLMLPQWEPLVDGHCLIVPMQHEGSSRNMDDDVWEELRNYKKCLLQMFTKQGRDVLFLETVMNLSQQRRHCLIECIPLPPDRFKQAPLYFKKAIDEAEDEWSQHDAKKLIDTSVKGLRGSIPKNFPYFHVEFGLHAGYVHVIDNERSFRWDFGRNVVIGMLKLPEEEMHRRRKQLSFEQQKKAVINFQKDWAPFDWTKMLD